MKGLKMILFGIALILVGGFFMLDPLSSLNGYGEGLCFIIGIIYCIRGLKFEEED